MGFDDWMDLNNDGDVSGGEAFLGLSSAGALGFAAGADEAQYAAHEERKKYERRCRDLEDERDELLEENKRLKKKHRSSYWDDDDDDDNWDDEDDDDDDDELDREETYREDEMQRLKEEAAFYKRWADENGEQIKALRAEIAELKRKLKED